MRLYALVVVILILIQYCRGQCNTCTESTCTSCSSCAGCGWCDSTPGCRYGNGNGATYPGNCYYGGSPWHFGTTSCSTTCCTGCVAGSTGCQGPLNGVTYYCPSGGTTTTVQVGSAWECDCGQGYPQYCSGSSTGSTNQISSSGGGSGSNICGGRKSTSGGAAVTFTITNYYSQAATLI